ncbi:galactonolactone dehydrogenase [Salpingoeca rosetta]|uniref:Galactonolactone dehydrogenase n=1 Tax=Salpingoeca rosetta (strain ATCC 50818 / BSB-021) TaxID=946362 RepID=F2U4K4_SALR5|nr:galactonolactone dehydrogenase [Salpingoeca rosetta]EGD82570.1 galactonolactone dehydrogenase [Salpingoeca rosetta]|eukprot:XP_004995806.1 galactonolactone dehydrogenase [Salpingoeca rosetta]
MVVGRVFMRWAAVAGAASGAALLHPWSAWEPASKGEEGRGGTTTITHGWMRGCRLAHAEAGRDDDDGNHDHDSHEVVNWSGTHTAWPRVFVEPNSLGEVEDALARAHATGQRLRVVGSAISPNGLAFSDEGMLSMVNCNRVLWVDPDSKQVCVEAGARVADVVEKLRPYGLTLQNYASIREQQIGGFVQAGAHGTGAAIPPADDQVVGFSLITPAQGTLSVTRESHPELFDLARVGLGALGIMGTVTLQCVDHHLLTERTSVITREEARRGHKERLRRNKHVRYMWIPYEDAVVVVECNNTTHAARAQDEAEAEEKQASEHEAYALAPLRSLLQQVNPSISQDRMRTMHFADLRDAILAANPRDVEHVKKCNAAEAEFWRRNQGITSVGYSDEVLGFECGGQQWVNEVCFPAGTLQAPDMADMAFMADLLALIEDNHVPAPAPIEQRWTRTSTSAMSVGGPGPGRVPAHEDGIHAWAGIIMYLCTADTREREAITQAFFKYRQLVADNLDAKYDAYVHWAKLEVPTDPAELRELRARMRERFPVDRFNHFRRRLDPRGVLSNTFIAKLFDEQEDNGTSHTSPQTA